MENEDHKLFEHRLITLENKNTWLQRGMFGMVTAIAGAVFNYGALNTTVLQNTVTSQENLEWRIGWVSGQQGILPVDNTQNTYIEVLQQKVVELQGQINKLYNDKADK